MSLGLGAATNRYAGYPRLYGGVRLVDRPAPDNVARLDHNAMRGISRMMQNGLAVDKGALDALRVQCVDEMADIERQMEGLTGIKVNPGSPKQVADLLFHKLHLGAGKVKKLTASKDRESTKEIDIEPYLHEHPVVPLIYEWRERDKIRGTYCEPLIEKARQDRHGNWLIHTQILWTRTTTGRYASKEPNLQNIPVRTALGLAVRKAFIARMANGKRKRLVTVDESQIEMRMAAHEAQCKGMIEILTLPEYEPDGVKKNPLADLHTRTAMSVFKIPAHEVHGMRHRYPMKRTGFGILYMITAEGLTVQLNNPEAQDLKAPHVWTVPETQTLINNWYQTYPEIRAIQDLYCWRARKYKMVWDCFGRTRLVPEVNSSLPWVVDAGLRQACNQPFQAGAGGTLKIATARVADEFAQLRSMGVYCEELMTIHDELLSETDPEIADEVGRIVGKAIEESAPLLVPIRWGAASGERWGELDK